MNLNITGFKNIHFAPLISEGVAGGRPTYETPVPIKGAKSLECTLGYESTSFYADDIVSFNENFFVSGELTVSVAGLSAEEYALLYGNKQSKGFLTVNANDIGVSGALLFEKKILGTNATRKYVIYNCKMAPANVSAQTLADAIEESPVELTGNCFQLSDGSIYAFVDTNAVDYDSALYGDWYDEVKFMEQTP